MIDDLVVRLRGRYAAAGPPAEPATDEAIADAQKRLGFVLPSRLVHLYQEFANGGFGPAFGIYGVGLYGHRSLEGWDIVDQYVRHRTARNDNIVAPDDPAYTLAMEGWPKGLLPMTAVVSQISYALDVVTGEVLSGDGDDVESGMTYATWLKREAPGLDEWLGRWLDGEELPAQGLHSWGGRCT